ncbi:MAG: SMODS domain-containing nucleotidyltransferase [Promethearchaeota archaeon]|jgi:hypothetical protein
MATTVSQAFDEFRQKLEPSKSEFEKIIRRHKYIREKFSNKIKNDGRKHSFLSGSYSRNTLIRPINDVDIVILFDIDEYWDQFKNNPSELLYFTKKKLEETYPDKKIIVQSHSIGIIFEEPPNVDIIPGFINNYENEIYIIPNYDLNNFIKTSPSKHKEIMSNHNQKLESKFIHVIKMMKCWRNKTREESLRRYGLELKFKSFHLEIFLKNLLKKTTSNYARDIYQVFSKAAEFMDYGCNDPAGLSGKLDDYLSQNQILKFKEVFNDTCEEIKILLKLEMEGKTQEAIKGWRDIFGEPFPKPIITQKDTYKKDLTTKFPPEGKKYTFGE